MRGIGKLLFGEDAGKVLDQFSGNDDDGFGLAERARRAGEWCGSTPGRGSALGAVARAAQGRKGTAARRGR